MATSRLKKLVATIGAIILSLSLVLPTEGAVLRFWPDTATTAAGWSVFQYQSPGGASPKQLAEKAAPNSGATGNHDPATPGGLFAISDWLVDLPAGQGYEAGYVKTAVNTQFTDTSLTLTGLTANGNAELASFMGMTLVGQRFSDGAAFVVKSYSPSAAVAEQILISGIISNAAMSGIAGQPNAGFQAYDVRYTGGLIYDVIRQALNVPAGQPLFGTANWDLKLTSALAVDGSSIRDFTATVGTGTFDVYVPEPASLGLFLIAGAALVLRRKR